MLLSEFEELFLVEDKGVELVVIECIVFLNFYEEKNFLLKYDCNKELEGEVNKILDFEIKDVLDGIEFDGGNNLFIERGDYIGVIDLEFVFNFVKIEMFFFLLKVNDVE